MSSTTANGQPQTTRSSASRRWLLAVATATVCLLSPAVAGATDPAATGAFDEGRALLAKGDVAGAKERFRASVDIEPSVGALLNLGECHSKLNENALAYRRYREAEALAAKGDKYDREGIARGKAEALRTKVGLFGIVLPEGTPTATLTIDDGEDFAIGRRESVAVEPGTHHFRVTSEGRRFEVTKSTAGGRSEVLRVEWPTPSATVVVAPTPTPTPTIIPSSPKPTEREGARTWALPSYVAAGVGAAAVVTGAVFGVLASGKKSDLEDACPRYPLCPSSLRDEATSLSDDAQQFATVSTVAIIAGVALVGTAVGLYVLSPKESRATQAYRTLTNGVRF
jgi:hypothetical protein